MEIPDITINDLLKCKNDHTFYILKDENFNVLKEIYIKPINQYQDLIKLNKTGRHFIENSHTCFEISRIEKIVNGKKYYVEVYNDITKTTKAHDRDQLTGLFNRTRIDREIAISSDETTIIVMGDLDGFKEINDTYGHLVGDEVLHYISAILKQNICKNDFIGRFGGDEFIIILHSSNLKKAQKQMEKIRRQINNKPFTYINNSKQSIDIPITITFGIYKHEKNDDYDDTLSKADKALYYAKNNGKNKTFIYDEKLEKELDI